jgi:hypothetical protein
MTGQPLVSSQRQNPYELPVLSGKHLFRHWGLHSKEGLTANPRTGQSEAEAKCKLQRWPLYPSALHVRITADILLSWIIYQAKHCSSEYQFLLRKIYCSLPATNWHMWNGTTYFDIYWAGETGRWTDHPVYWGSVANESTPAPTQSLTNRDLPDCSSSLPLFQGKGFRMTQENKPFNPSIQGFSMYI